MSNKIECAYSKCKKKFVPKSARQQYCCDTHRVYGNRESNSAEKKSSDGHKAETPHPFDAFCASIGVTSKALLDWVKVNYAKPTKEAKNEGKSKFKQTEIPLESPNLANGKIIGTLDRLIKESEKVDKKKSPPAREANPRFDRRKLKLGF